jgi:hypothetical protein
VPFPVLLFPLLASSVDVTAAAAAADCPNGATVSEAVSRRLAHPAATPVHVAFDGKPGAYTAVIRVGRSDATRQLSDAGPTCGALGDAVVVAVSILLDELDTPNEPESAPSQPSSRELTSGWLAHANVGGAVGVVRPVATSVGLGIVGEIASRWAFGIDGLVVPTQSLALAPGTVDVGLLALGPTACVRVVGKRRSIRTHTCGSFMVGVLSATGHGYTRDSNASRPWLAPGASVVVNGPVFGAVGWLVRVSGIMPISDEAFSIQNVGAAYAPPRVGGFFVAGATVSSN